MNLSAIQAEGVPFRHEVCNSLPTQMPGLFRGQEGVTNKMMRNKRISWKHGLVFAAALVAVSATELAAQNAVIFIHGRSGSNHCGTSTTDVNNYWGNAKNISTSLTRYFVGYDGSTDPRTWGSCRAQTNLNTVLTNNCTGSKRCRIICHSAGCYATGYFLDKLSSNTFNIDAVFASSSAAGGSELANLAFWATGGMDAALKTGEARNSSLFNQNDNKGVSIHHLAGYKGDFYSAWYLPGEDDGAVSFHSTCGIAKTGSFSKCTASARYTGHYIWTGTSASSYGSSQAGYYRRHVGDGSDSINDATRLEYNRCRSSGLGCQ